MIDSARAADDNHEGPAANAEACSMATGFGWVIDLAWMMGCFAGKQKRVLAKGLCKAMSKGVNSNFRMLFP